MIFLLVGPGEEPARVGVVVEGGLADGEAGQLLGRSRGRSLQQRHLCVGVWGVATAYLTRFERSY